MRQRGQLLACSQTAWVLRTAQWQASERSWGKVRWCSHSCGSDTTPTRSSGATKNVLSGIQVSKWHHNFLRSDTQIYRFPFPHLITQRRMRWLEMPYARQTWEIYTKVWSEKSEVKRSLGRPRCRWQGIKMTPKECGERVRIGFVFWTVYFQ